MQDTVQSPLPAEVVDRAVRLIARQGATPTSPGTRTADGGVALCAGAALAVAGLEIRGEAGEAEAFRDRIAESGSTDDIREVFAEQGWPAAECDAAVIMNDRLSSKRRTAGVLAHFRALKSRIEAGSEASAS